MLNQYSHLLTHKKLRFNFGKYTLICKLGDYCNFGLEQQSNNLHAHSSYELCLILSGSGQFMTNNECFDVNTHDIIIANPYTYHEITCDHFSELSLLYIFINISPNPLSTLTITKEALIIQQFLEMHSSIYKSHTKLFSFFNCINNYCQLNSTLDTGLYHLLQLLILECLSGLTIQAPSSPIQLLAGHPIEKSEDCVSTHILPITTLEKAQDYIDIHLHQKIYIEDIAKYCSVSPRTLQYTFKKELNTSLVDYITERKIKLACHYLLNHFSIIDTANLVGIPNMSYFNKTFKTIMGLTPGQIYKLATNPNDLGRRLD